jgi:hypothetical protein
MAIEVRYECGCTYLHFGDREIRMTNSCDKHKELIINNYIESDGM